LICGRSGLPRLAYEERRYAPDRRRKSRPQADDKSGALGEHAFRRLNPEPEDRDVYANEIRAHLDRLNLELLAAESAGLTECRAYMKDLENEISECRAAFVGAVVTEIAVARGELSGRLLG
jgi:hypothetical protein